MKTREQLLKEKYGYNKASYKYIPAGCEILKYIGQIVVFIDFKKNEKDAWEISSTEKAQINSISSFDPMTMTYLCKYRLASDKKEDPDRELRIVPEGFSWGNPEETGEMKRFIPYSMHCTLVEDEAFWIRLSELWKTRDTLSIESLINLSNSKEREVQLKYTHNIGALIKLDSSGDLLWTRITGLTITHKAGTKYKLRFENDRETWTVMISSEDKDYDFESGIGRVKLIDLAG